MAVVACGVAVAIVLVVGVADGSSRHGQDRSAGAAKTVPRNLASSYGFLTSPSSVVLPRGLGSAVVGLPGGYGINPSLGREAGSVGTHHLWLIPGRSGSCLELADGGSACGPNAFVARQGVWLMLVPVTGAAPTVYGVVPDGASVSGHAARVSQSGNAFMVRPSSRRAGRVTVHLASGASVSVAVPAATGHPQSGGREATAPSSVAPRRWRRGAGFGRWIARGKIAQGWLTTLRLLGGRDDFPPAERSAVVEDSIAAASGALSPPVGAAEACDVSRGDRRPLMCGPPAGRAARVAPRARCRLRRRGVQPSASDRRPRVRSRAATRSRGTAAGSTQSRR